ncbi:MAG: Ni/Fe hydrogenase subunit alpha [Spirochaetales bacterium]|nr:Ni/Fe hydrogenase subunit alpha [Spirochaetales bacterium]
MTKKTMNVSVHHITRVEGHGNIVVDIDEGTIKTVQWQVPEAPRFFEAMVVGRNYTEIASITSRICGICSIGHTFASLKATEAAMGIRISETTRILRELLLHGETLQSHLLHICYLAVPDFVKAPSVIPLIKTHREVVLLVTKLHRLANEMCDIIGGRTTHPIRARIGAFSMNPSQKQLEELRKRLTEAVSDMKALADFVVSISDALPSFRRETEYLALTCDSEYAFYDGEIMTTDIEKPIPVNDYREVVNEFVVPQSTAKYGKFNRGSFMVGALARYNNNYRQLSPMALEVGKKLGLDGKNDNPFMNTIAQLVECVFAAERSITLVNRLIENPQAREKPEITIKEGQGVGAVEVPRGILFHDYTYDNKGILRKANCVIPTNLNHNNIQLDMEKVVPEYMERGKEELQFILEMLVRAYDPCISCSTHYLNIRFKE